MQVSPSTDAAVYHATPVHRKADSLTNDRHMDPYAASKVRIDIEIKAEIFEIYLSRFREANEAISNMKSLSLLSSGHGDGLMLAPTFRKGLKEALFSG